MEIYAVIMAGGVGSRFWPRSKEKTPKQLLRIFGEKTMIQDTVDRLKDLVSYKNILIITNKLQREEIIRQLPEVPAENVIEEPFGRNTAACIGLASLIINERNPEAVSIVLPADHIIRDIKSFHNTLKTAAEFAESSDGLVTIGISPSRPETGYGYIQIEENEESNGIHKVLTFAEKPNYATAVRFLESGDFMWNSGMFIWKVNSILEEISIYLPDLWSGLEEIKGSIGTENFEKKVTSVYGQLKSISIDYGIMEKSTRVYLTKGFFVWSDVGSWEEVYQLTDKDNDGNAKEGNVYCEMTSDSYVYSPDKFTAVVGLENVIVINTDTALLVCRRDHSQDVKKVVDYLKINKFNELI